MPFFFNLIQETAEKDQKKKKKGEKEQCSGRKREEPRLEVKCSQIAKQ